MSHNDSNEVSEGEALSEILESMEDYENRYDDHPLFNSIFDLTQRRGARGVKKAFRNFSIPTAKSLYETNKAAKVGETICCAFCKKSIQKKSYQQAFCRTKCKDRFWNSTVDSRRERANLFSK
jgi:hypothetical protein